MAISYPENQPPRPTSWGQTAALFVGIIVGIIGLIWFAGFVIKRSAGAPPQNLPRVIRYEIVAIWLHPQLYELANDPIAVDSLRSFQAFYAYVTEHKLEHTWCVVVIRHVQSSGPSPVTSVIRRPHDVPSLYPDPLVVLNAAAGRLPHSPLTDYSKLKVGIFPDQLLDVDHYRAAEQLQWLEPIPGRGPRDWKDR
jgi:hypothetical protein